MPKKVDNSPRKLIEVALGIIARDLRRIRAHQNGHKQAKAVLNEKMSEAASRYLTKLQALADWQEGEATQKLKAAGKMTDAELKKAAGL